MQKSFTYDMLKVYIIEIEKHKFCNLIMYDKTTLFLCFFVNNE